MVKKELIQIRNVKKTTDIYLKPKFLVEKTAEIDKSTHFDLLKEKIEDDPKLSKIISSKIFKMKEDRMSLTQRREINFNKYLQKSLCELLKCQNDTNRLIYNLIIDYHIKYHYIDRYNKNELFLLLISNHKKYEMEISKLGYDPAYESFIRAIRKKDLFKSLLTFMEADPIFFDELLFSFFSRKPPGQKYKFYEHSCLNHITNKNLAQNFPRISSLLQERIKNFSKEKNAIYKSLFSS